MHSIEGHLKVNLGSGENDEVIYHACVFSSFVQLLIDCCLPVEIFGCLRHRKTCASHCNGLMRFLLPNCDLCGMRHTFEAPPPLSPSLRSLPLPFEAPSVKCYLRICDLFFNLLSYMTTLTLVVLPVVVSLLH